MELKIRCFLCIIIISFGIQAQNQYVNTLLNEPINNDIGIVGDQETIKLIASPRYEITTSGIVHFKAKRNIVLKTGFKIEEGGRFKASVDNNYRSPNIIFWGAMDPDLIAKNRDLFYDKTGIDGLIYPNIWRDWYCSNIDETIFPLESRANLEYANEKFKESYIKAAAYSIINWEKDWNSTIIANFKKVIQIICDTKTRGLALDLENYPATSTGICSSDINNPPFNDNPINDERVSNFGISQYNFMKNRDEADVYRKQIFEKGRLIGEAVADKVYQNNYEDEFKFVLVQEGELDHYDNLDENYAFYPYFVTGILNGMKISWENLIDRENREKIELKFFWENTYHRTTVNHESLFPSSLYDIKSTFKQALTPYLNLTFDNVNYDVTDYYDEKFRICFGSNPIQGPRECDDNTTMCYTSDEDYKNVERFSSSEFRTQLNLFRKEELSPDDIWIYSYGHTWWQYEENNTIDDTFWKFLPPDIDYNPSIWVANHPLAYAEPRDDIEEYYRVLRDISPNLGNENKDISITKNAVNSNEIRKEERLILIPNPITNIGNVELELTKEAIIEIKILNIRGEILKTITPDTFFGIGKYYFQINVEDLPRGMYLIDLKIEDKHKVIKMIKK